MKPLFWQSWAAMIAFAISLVFLWTSNPYAIGAFTFIAQPLFLTAFCGFAYKVLRELRRRKII